MNVRTNIVIDRGLVEHAKALTGIKTTRAVVHEALQTLVQRREQASVRQLRGKLHWEGDLEASRVNRFVDEELAGNDPR
jgi:Arc/MetJ family transcription regulator